MTKHTPGPWTAYYFAADWWVANPEDDSGPMLRVGSDHDRREANAHLIAAAPDLLNISKEILDLIERIIEGKEWGAIEEYADQLRTIIARATGESHD